MKILAQISAAAAALVLVGCATSGFNRGELRQQVGVTAPEYTNQEIKEELEKKANLPKPFRLAVFFKAPHAAYGQPKWRWNDEDKSLLTAVGEELEKQGIVSSVFPILPSLVAGDDLLAIRVAAAKHHADAVLVVNGGAQVERSLNNLGWTYILLVPALFVPGSQADTLFYSNATLWDVRNEYLYLTAESEAVKSTSYVPAFGKRDEELVASAKSEALAKLKTEVVRGLQGKQK